FAGTTSRFPVSAKSFSPRSTQLSSIFVSIPRRAARYIASFAVYSHDDSHMRSSTQCKQSERSFSLSCTLRGIHISGGKEAGMPANNALERTVRHGGPRLAAARSLCPAAQLD